jgi:putative tryptophan/tyrosine transport system substrate-binding protein
MRRREFIMLLGGAAAWPLAARAQQSAKVPTIGFLAPNTAVLDGPRIHALVQRLGELGWVEGRNITIEYRYAEGRNEHFGDFASELVRLKVDVIVTSATPPTLAAKKATSSIPIVFASVGDPIGAGLVASLARPGGNITGLSLQQSDTAAKRLGMLREVVPGLRHVAIAANVDNASVQLDLREVQSAAVALGIEPIKFEMRRSEDIAPAINAVKGRADALYVCNDPVASTNRVRICELALDIRLPTMCGAREYVEAGGLMSYAANFPDLFRRTAEYVDKILRGAKPSELPVEQPTKFDLIINLKTAKALGLTIAPTMLARADDVLE